MSHLSTKGERVRRTLANTFLGLLFIAVGVGYLGNEISVFPWQNFTLFFPGWGSLFMIVPSLYFLIRKPWSWFWMFTLLVGVLILLSNMEKYSFGQAAAIILAVLVILIGLRVIFTPLFRRMKRKHWQKKKGIMFGDAHVKESGDATYVARFGDKNVDLSGQVLTAATIEIFIGDMDFFANNAIIKDCAVLDVKTTIGNVDIHLPSYVRVVLTPTVFMADVQNHHVDDPDPNAPVVYINAECSLGDISIH